MDHRRLRARVRHVRRATIGISTAIGPLLGGFIVKVGGLVISPNVTLTLAEVDVRYAGSGRWRLLQRERTPAPLRWSRRLRAHRSRKRWAWSPGGHRKT